MDDRPPMSNDASSPDGGAESTPEATPREVVQTAAAVDESARPADATVERFWEIARRLPRYLQLAANLARDSRVPGSAKGVLAVGGAYTLSPIDLVPGIIPVAGQLDDLFVLLLALRQALRACPADVATEHLERADLSMAIIDDDLAAIRRTAVWVAGKGLRLGGRLAAYTGRQLWGMMRRRRALTRAAAVEGDDQAL